MGMDRPPCGLFVGLCTVDIQYLVDSVPQPDDKTAARELAVAAGGPATNAAVAFAHLGGESRLLTRIGTHPFTTFMEADLRRCRVRAIDLDPGETALPTVSSIVSIPATAQRSIVTFRAESAIEPDGRLLSASLDGVDIVLLDGFHLNAALAIATLARRRGIPVVLDGGSWHEGMASLLPLVEIAICAETFRPPGTESPASVFQYLTTQGVTHSAITAGGEAILWNRDGRVAGLPVEHIDAVDTSGAGDFLHGAFCAAYARRGDFVAALEVASRVATRSCQSFGTRAWLREEDPAP